MIHNIQNDFRNPFPQRQQENIHKKKLSGKINFHILKQIVKKMMFANSVFDIINNLTRFIVLYELLGAEIPPVQAATVSSIAASSLPYLAINIIIKRINVFGSKKRYFKIT
jgi:hypothetical protein